MGPTVFVDQLTVGVIEEEEPLQRLPVRWRLGVPAEPVPLRLRQKLTVDDTTAHRTRQQLTPPELILPNGTSPSVSLQGPTREALVWKLDGLSEYDVRRPLTVTGTNLLGLVKHLATGEARYLGEIFDRPFPGPLPDWQDADGSDLWVTPDESREQIIGFYRRAWEHADATIAKLPIDTAGHVPWWPSPDVKLLNMMASPCC